LQTTGKVDYLAQTVSTFAFKTNQYVNIWNRLERNAEFATGFSPSGENEKMALNI
jgi:hypothetical protein